MDKNMINIDDLLKQRLTGGEEKERPGAWLQMRDLLDKEMPVTGPVPGSSVNWRRMFGYLSALLLVSAVSIGGYQMTTADRTESKTGEGMAMNVPNPANYTNSSSGSTAVPSAAKTATSTESPALSKDTATPSNPFRKKNKAKLSATNTAGKNDLVNTSKAAASTDNKTATANVKNTTKHNKSQQVIAGNKEDKLLTDSKKQALTETLNTGTKQVVTVGNTTNHNNPVSANQAPKDRTYASAGKLSKTKNPALKGKKGSAQVSANNNNTAATNTTNHNNVVGASTAAASETSKTGVTKPQADYTVAKQIVPKIEIRETYDRRSGKRIIDTITGKAELDILVPVVKTVATAPVTPPPAYKQPTITVNDEIVAAANNNTPNNTIVPASSMSLNANTTESNDNLVPLSNFKVSSKQGGAYARTNLIEQMIQNAKVNVGQAKFYGGVIGGLNSSLSGNNSMWGFQMGLSGLLSLNERWGIVSELKFMQRFNSQAIANNGYANLDSSASTGAMVYSWDSVNRSFNFPTVSAVELPLYIKYTLSRFNFHAGMNLTYNFSIKNIDLKEFTIHQVNNEGPVMEGAVNYSFDNGVPKIEIADFSSRFSLGYLFGMGYQLSPALQVDVRMTKALMDNAKTAGSKELSRKVFNNPSVQVNLNYRFSNNKFKPYHK